MVTILLMIAISGFSQIASLNDSAFLSSFKEVRLDLDKVKPAASKKWQLIAGSCSMEYRQRTNEEYRQFEKKIDSIVKLNPAAAGIITHIQELRDSFQYYRKYYIRFHYKSSNKISDELEGYKLCQFRGFGTWCPPSGCNWFIFDHSGKKTNAVISLPTLLKFLGAVDNPYKAYIVLLAHQFGNSGGFPNAGAPITYKQVEQKIYLIQELRLNDCPVQVYKCLIEINANGTTNILDKKIIHEGGCI